MRKFTIEEKAKAYDGAIKKAKALYDSSETMSACSVILETVFPELKESEDERIRKELISFLQLPHPQFVGERKQEKWIVWLEKQGELVNSLSKGLDNAHERIDELIQKNNELYIKLEKQDDQKETNLVEILKHYPKETELYSPLYGKLWLAEVDEKHEIIICYKYRLTEGCTRAVLEQEDTVSFYSNGTTGLPDYTTSKDCMLFLYDIEKQELKMNEQKQVIDYPDILPKDNWELIHEFVEKFRRIPKDEDELNVLVEYVLKRQKPAEWSEEDMQYFNFLEKLLEILQVKSTENEIKMGTNSNSEYYYKVIQWLKSIKGRIL